LPQVKIKYKLKKNFLDKKSFDSLKKEIFSNRFGWFWHEHQIAGATAGYSKGDRGFFGHNFYLQYIPNSVYFEPLIIPILKKLECKMVSDIRSNCIVKDKVKHFSHFHCDRKYDCTTAILYMNTNNGYTLLGEKEKIKIKSEENTMLIFNSQIKHCAVSQTDTERRVVINFNYI